MNLANRSWEILGKLVKYIKYEIKACLKNGEDCPWALFIEW